ncbi:MAG: flagellar protein FlaG [Chitinispirillia bacterium]|nr:flagellar protein FlaG [Chitinispirillia bacterium]MCL2241892.1 flagellar protein FlaG [Chitinispirillia bacterium]
MTLNSVSSTKMAPVYTGGDAVSTTQAHTAPAQAQPAASAPAANITLLGAGNNVPEKIHMPGDGSKAVEKLHMPGDGSKAADDAELDKLMEEPVRQANKALQPFHREIEREIHHVTKALMYTIRDTETKEVIAEYPPKKIQDMIAKMWELAGLFIDQKA